MALAVTAAHSCSMCFSNRCMRSMIILQSRRKHFFFLHENLRLKSFLFTRIPYFSSQSEKKFPEIVEEAWEMKNISERSKFLKKMSVLVGYDGSHDFIESEVADNKCGRDCKVPDDFDITMACKPFSSIILGSSPPVELYDENTAWSRSSNLFMSEICDGFIPGSVDTKLNNSDSFQETWSTLLPAFGVANSLSLEDVTLDLQNTPTKGTDTGPKHGDQDKKAPVQLMFDKSTSSIPGPKNVDQDKKAPVQLMLDTSISFIPGLSKRHLLQLEKCGFHTLRKLLHHFPRTYADFQNAGTTIEDGQYLIFVGKVVSSKAIKASYSFSFLEVVVGCEVAEQTDAHLVQDFDISKSEVANHDAANRNVTDEFSCGKRMVFLHLKKFFRGTRFTYLPFLKSLQGKHEVGDCVCVSGKVKHMRTDHYEIKEYNIDVLDNEQDSSVIEIKGRPYPIYPSKGGLNPNSLRDFISRALPTLSSNVDPIPQDITKDFGLKCLHETYLGIHQPKDFIDAELSRKRLIFDEFFYLQLGRLFQMLEGLGTQLEKEGMLDKYRDPKLNTLLIEDWSSLTQSLLKALPYSLTSSQLRAVSEIIWDLKRPVPMNRLLQGDVGCGKTVVAFLACMEVISSGYQAAFMVPTELLAIQHYEQLLDLLKEMSDVDVKPTVALLTGSTPSKQARIICEGLQKGDISIVVGTHSLISEKISFSALRIAVVDEQHRFGVVQRGRFNSKLYYKSFSEKLVATTSSDGSLKGEDAFMAPHVLAMSATPIPRTLALALYGDMSLTQITDLPPGRLPIETQTMEGDETCLEKVYKMMLNELKTGGKIYLVYPVIQQSEQLPQLRAASPDFEIISSKFEPFGYNCGLLHGRMKSHDKDEVLRKFRLGEIQILLSTQVIEIGVDVPDASMMVVMNAERFGIAQLHQLRGRVGRGMRQSKCILLASTDTGLSRLKILEKSSDGYYLANMDLVLRGPGDLLGKKQSGHLPEFPIARLEMDGNILQDAHLAALKILSISHDLKKYPDLKTELSMRHPLCLLGD
ncbi:ATP-dependent DNA helicase homolog RECG, chloroplastic [Impatiens glandulifera]|uniref:ATP-dependent DNA helicase homolog RECG, chloroplastic n=1 Tax=Impatiens glandulifera TaxID=253017 RepID=UPI001FB198F0|nr:ATP-dependent DNA helicase homolog RECG, chloroplastic [Impatiens glandulifera]XP_047340997.1 ATP-dependent DNA helicase homolog RECG, chloroplastic [Impatiens glandulifera]XP_047340998.1 ATP-dependent DNA helicase homolog RECG, chloroplastic [Impatiens glandulifera]